MRYTHWEIALYRPALKRLARRGDRRRGDTSSAEIATMLRQLAVALSEKTTAQPIDWEDLMASCSACLSTPVLWRDLAELVQRQLRALDPLPLPVLRLSE